MQNKKGATSMVSDPALVVLNKLVGTWTTEATHPAVPGVVVRGSVFVEWLEGEQFLLHRARTDHPDFPDTTSIIGFTNRDRVDDVPGINPGANKPQLVMHSYDSRGVFRILNVSIDEQSLRLWRDAPGFSMRFTGTFDDRGKTINGLWRLCQDDVHWKDDLQITYRHE